jgi:hypothetical protein
MKKEEEGGYQCARDIYILPQTAVRVSSYHVVACSDNPIPVDIGIEAASPNRIFLDNHIETVTSKIDDGIALDISLNGGKSYEGPRKSVERRR